MALLVTGELLQHLNQIVFGTNTHSAQAKAKNGSFAASCFRRSIKVSWVQRCVGDARSYITQGGACWKLGIHTYRGNPSVCLWWVTVGQTKRLQRTVCHRPRKDSRGTLSAKFPLLNFSPSPRVASSSSSAGFSLSWTLLCASLLL